MDLVVRNAWRFVAGDPQQDTHRLEYIGIEVKMVFVEIVCM